MTRSDHRWAGGSCGASSGSAAIIQDMSDLERRPGTGLSRRQRERRVYSLMVTGSVAGIIGAVTLVLAIFGVTGAGLPIVLLVVAAVCALLVRRTVGG